MKLFSALAVQLLAILLRESSRGPSQHSYYCPEVEVICNCTGEKDISCGDPTQSRLVFLLVGLGLGCLITALALWLARKGDNGNSPRNNRRRGGGVLEDSGPR